MLIKSSLAKPSATRKEDVAREILVTQPIGDGAICVLKRVEPCVTLNARGNCGSQKLELNKDWGKCLHVYHYYLDPVFRFMHARIPTWFPFSIDVCVDGREWLARRMNEEGVAYKRYDNCFSWVGEFVRAKTRLAVRRSSDNIKVAEFAG